MEMFRVLLTAVCLVAAFAADAAAQSDLFFKGKQIKIVVGFTAGGIIDLWARLYTQHLGKYIPGNPDLIVQNVAGGGSMIAANQLYNVAKPDGLTLAMISSGLYFDQLMGVKEVQFDWAKFCWIGSPVRNFEVLTMRADTPYRSIEDIQKAPQPPRCGTTGTGATGQGSVFARTRKIVVEKRLRPSVGAGRTKAGFAISRNPDHL